MTRKLLFLALASSLTLGAAVDAMAGTGKIVIVNNDRAGTGFNDSTPVAPVGGNDGTTLGQQRMNVFLAAAARWTTMLDTNVDIIAQATFSPISAPCTADSAVLGQAGPTRWLRDFAGAPRAAVWYPVALANKFAGTDLGPTIADINVQFNAAVDNQTCLGDSDWYYGFDGNNGIDSDLYVVVLHELAHGLGIAGVVRSPGFLEDKPAIFDTHLLDVSAGLRWDQMNEAQRSVSYTNTGNLVWDGENVRAMIARYLQPLTMLTVTEPSIVAKNYDIGFADFGAPGNTAPLSGRIVRAADAANTDGTSLNDACTALTNAAAINGNVAFIDRGSCTFVIKARNAQAAGATAVIIGDRIESYTDDNPATCLPPGMTGQDAGDITIPVISVGINDANALKTQFTAGSNVSGLLRKDSTQLAGTSREGFLRVYAPCIEDPGSSIHHWDSVATPNLLMEPAVNSDLLHGVDLTLYQLLDLGWTLPPRTGRRILKR
jgi:hypothetical protein